MKTFVIVFLLILISIGLYLLYNLGMFESLQVSEKEIGSYTIIYQEHKGDYKGVGPIMNEVYETLKIENIETTRGIGIFYDNPANTKKEELRSDVGCIVEKEDYEKLSQALSNLDKKFLTKKIEKKKRVVVEFPYRNKLSYIVGPIKVYPSIKKYTEEKNLNTGAGMEIYDIPNHVIIYSLDVNE